MKKLLIIVLILFNIEIYSEENKSIASEIVNSYINQQLSVDVEDYYTVLDFFHPDIAFAPGDRTYIHVVALEHEIVDIKQEILNVNLINPENEEIITVSVIFKTLFDIEDGSITKSEYFKRNFYLSASTGELLILYFSEPFWKTVTLESVVKWAEKMKSHSNKWNDLYNQIIVFQKEGKITDNQY